jgi:hypothetical protein
MQYKFIPVNNSIDKARAFANSLDNDFLKNNQQQTQKKFYIPTLDVISKFQDEGWQLKGVSELRSKKTRKITNNFIQLQHPDLMVRNSMGKTEAVSSITISNSCNGNKPMSMDMGVYRLVCQNGMISYDRHGKSEKIKHTGKDYANLDNFIYNMNSRANELITTVNLMKERGMGKDGIREFAIAASKIRYNEDVADSKVEDLMKVHRDEDKGDDVWTVFNRIQENLTHDIANQKLDIMINKQLFQLANNEMQLV